MEIFGWFRRFRRETDIHRTHEIATVFLISRDGYLLVLERSSEDLGAYRFEVPGGGVDFQETFYDAAVRELWEEVELKASISDRIVGEELQDISERIFRFFRMKARRHVVSLAGRIDRNHDVIKVTLDPRAHVGYKWVPKRELETSGLPPEKQDHARRAWAIYFPSH